MVNVQVSGLHVSVAPPVSHSLEDDMWDPRVSWVKRKKGSGGLVYWAEKDGRPAQGDGSGSVWWAQRNGPAQIKQLAGRLRHGSAWQIDLGSAPQAGSGWLGLTGRNKGHDPTALSLTGGSRGTV